MEIPDISMISDFEAGVNCLQNPSMASRFFKLSGIERVPQVYSFWKWGAVILAVLATFGSLIKRLKLFFIRFRTVKPSAEPLLQLFSDDFDFSDDDDDECSSVSSLEDDEDDQPTTSFQDDQDFRVKGGDFYVRERWQNGNLRLRRRQTGGQKCSWSEFSTGKNVVKLWGSLGFGFDYEDSCENVVSTWDSEENQKVSDFLIGRSESTVAGLAAPSRPVVLMAEVNGDRNGIILGAYDTRMRHQTPAVYAKWDPPAVASKVVAGIDANGVKKVYIRDDVNGVLTVGDLRNFKTPLETVTESDGDTWWDADAVIVDEDTFDC